MLSKGWRASRTAALALLPAALAACTDNPGNQGGLLPDARPVPAAPAMAVSPGCKSSGMNRGHDDAANTDLNDYARALYDADESPTLACVDSAAAIMTKKINVTLNSHPAHFGNCAPTTACGFNAGAYVALMFAAADRIAARGGMTASLDSALRRVEAAYVYNEVADGCALQSTDNCMDGHSVAASGYGWIAAYRYLRRDPEASIESARASTRLHVSETFKSACIFAGFGKSFLCKTPATSVLRSDSTISFNLGHRHIAYGFGLMTSVAAGVLGYEVTGVQYLFPPHERIIALLLFEEAQRAIIGETTFRRCPKVRTPSFVGADTAWLPTTDSVPCGGEEGYQPQMYALNRFYATEIGPTPSAGTYTSTAFNGSLFTRGASGPDGFFSWGRFETYGRLAYDWLVTPRPHQRFVDAYAPHGWVDGIDIGRNLVGWACDRDVPLGSVRVTVNAPGKTAITQRANVASEQAIANQCLGGFAHRFSILLPNDWAGLTVSATVTDYFGFRSAPMGCSQCVVPSVTVEWLLPSGVSWGPPNTLTAAGLVRYGQGTVMMEWRDVTVRNTTAWITVAWQPPPDHLGQWSNTLPSSNYCHTYEVRATYNNVLSPVLRWVGKNSGHCAETARLIWIQPSSTAGFGTPGAIVIAGEARGAPAGTVVSMYYRNVTLNGPYVKGTFDSNTDANGIWLNEIHNANPLHRYAVYATYDVITTPICTYAGTNSITWC